MYVCVYMCFYVCVYINRRLGEPKCRTGHVRKKRKFFYFNNGFVLFLQSVRRTNGLSSDLLHVFQFQEVVVSFKSVVRGIRVTVLGHFCTLETFIPTVLYFCFLHTYHTLEIFCIITVKVSDSLNYKFYQSNVNILNKLKKRHVRLTTLQ